MSSLSWVFIFAVALTEAMPHYTNVNKLPLYEVHAGDNYDLGLQMGARFASSISDRYSRSTELNTLLECVRGEGKSAYDIFLSNATRQFPQYVRELRGISDGSGQPFDAVFAMNMREEIGEFCPELANHEWVGHCSDVVIAADGSSSEGSAVLLDAHNEDSGGNDVNNTFILHAHLGATDNEFWAYVYAGDLPSGAFGWMPNRSLAFSLNYVQPSVGVLGGYGRGFLSRALLDTKSIDEMTQIATMDGQCAGHNYQLMDFSAKIVLNVEAANYGQHAIYEVVAAAAQKRIKKHWGGKRKEDESTTSPFFHANEYLHLAINQTYSASSQARELRFSQLPSPVDLVSALDVIGDTEPTSPPILTAKLMAKKSQEDTYTIYRDGTDGGYTLHSAIFDIIARTITVLGGNPKDENVLFRFDV